MDSSNHLKIVNWNSRSILPKKTEFLVFLCQHQIDIATVSETWLNHTSSFRLPGYRCVRADRRSETNERGGGVLIVIKEGIKYSQLDLRTDSMDAVGIEIHHSIQPVHIIAIYFPGAHRCTAWNVFRRDISKLVRRSVPFFIAGDFNARHRQWYCLKANKAGNILASQAASSGFFVHAPTTFTYQPSSRRPSTLDLVLSNNIVDMSVLTVVNDLSSDHLPVRFDINITVPFNPVNPTTRCYSRANWREFQRVVNDKIDLSSPVIANLNCPETIHLFSTVLMDAEAVAIPYVSVKRNKVVQFPESIRQLVKLRNKRRRQWFRTRDPLLSLIIDSLNSRIHRECSAARNKKFADALKHLGNGANDVWKMCKVLRNDVKYNPPLKQGNSLVAAPALKANLLAESFARAHRNPLPSDPSTLSEVEDSVLQIMNSANTSDAVPMIRPKELEKTIKSLKIKKAPGHDKICNILLKHLPRKGLVFLTKIMNACLRVSHFPSNWKHAIVTAIPKAGKDITLPNNYRPISLLPTMSKILERVILSRITSHLEEHRIVPLQQFGFKRGHSTIHQLVRLTNDIKDSFTRRQSAGMVLLDVEKAYDSVWQNAILHKMKLADFPQYILKLLYSFLNNRSFQVVVDGELSHHQQIPFGVPQGAVLSPILYNIFMSDLVMIDGIEYYLFADDTGFVAFDKNPKLIIEKLQSAQDALEGYQRRWKIKINPTKTQAIFFSRRRSQRFLPQTQVTAMNHAIPWLDHVKYLGLTLDQKLKFDKHVANLLEKCDKLTRMLYPLVRRRSRLSNASKILLYKAIFRPSLTYGFPAWFNCARSRRKKIQLRQNKLLKTMLNLPFNFPSDELHDVAKVEALDSWTNRLLLKFRTGCSMSENHLISNLVP